MLTLISDILTALYTFALVRELAAEDAIPGGSPCPALVAHVESHWRND